jgi:hypothetical protein
LLVDVVVLGGCFNGNLRRTCRNRPATGSNDARASGQSTLRG